MNKIKEAVGQEERAGRRKESEKRKNRKKERLGIGNSREEKGVGRRSESGEARRVGKWKRSGREEGYGE